MDSLLLPTLAISPTNLPRLLTAPPVSHHPRPIQCLNCKLQYEKILLLLLYSNSDVGFTSIRRALKIQTSINQRRFRFVYRVVGGYSLYFEIVWWIGLDCVAS